MRMKKIFTWIFNGMPVGHGHAVRTDCRIGYIEVCVQVAWPDPPLSGSFLSARREYTDELGD